MRVTGVMGGCHEKATRASRLFSMCNAEEMIEMSERVVMWDVLGLY
jgi:hypothetical protein